MCFVDLVKLYSSSNNAFKVKSRFFIIRGGGGGVCLRMRTRINAMYYFRNFSLNVCILKSLSVFLRCIYID